MQLLEMPSLESYEAHLQQSPQEARFLFRELLIGVTNFFRDPLAFQALEKSVISKILQDKGSNDVVRVWVPGCSTGEEAFSIAMLFREQMDNLRTVPKVQIFATDIDEDALSVARSGRYPAGLIDGVPQERLNRFFMSDDISYTISKDIRDLCIFSPHSVLKDPPFSRIDLISCRNLLIYFGADFQSKVIPIFHFALKPDGYLFLGSSENIGGHGHLFAPIDKKYRIFQRRAHVVGPLPFPSFVPIGNRAGSHLNDHRDQHGSATVNLRRVVESRVLDHFTPAYVVINNEGNVVLYSARTGKYLEPSPGVPSHQLVTMTRRGLRLDLRAAIREAKETRHTATRSNVAVEFEDRVQLVDLTVEPLGHHPADPLFLVLFADVGQPQAADAKASTAAGDQNTERLEQELTDTRERLQATIEEYETAMEELKSSNEELQSMNEELQSTNEELETSKEELQSLNEELHTVNAELNSKVEEVDRSNSDLRNLFESTQIATIFLDRDLIIRGFTPAVVGIFNLISSDRGRPLMDIVNHLQPEGDLRRDILSVIEHGQPVERRVRRTDSTATFLMRILPYRGRNNVIDGALVTFVDVTTLVEAEAHQKLLIDELNHRVRNMLSVIGAIASQTVASTPAPDQFKEVFLGRLRAMADAHGLISRQQWGPVSLGSIIETELSAYRTAADKVAIEGPPVFFDPPKALALSLVIHELATNAAKYGTLSSAKGSLAIRWTTSGDRLDLVWHEKDGPKVKMPKSEGFGTELVRSQVQSALGGSVDFIFADSGLQVRFTIPGQFLNAGVKVRGIS
jgi:two-component system CheB/CheR fusion protein